MKRSPVIIASNGLLTNYLKLFLNQHVKMVSVIKKCSIAFFVRKRKTLEDNEENSKAERGCWQEKTRELRIFTKVKIMTIMTNLLSMLEFELEPISFKEAVFWRTVCIFLTKYVFISLYRNHFDSRQSLQKT